MESLLDFEWEQNMLGAEEISVDDEIKGTGEIFMSKHTAKTEEEINKFCSKDGLGEIERIEFLMRNGIFVQKCFVLQSFGNLSRSNLRDGLRDRIIPICLEIMFAEPIPFQIQLGQTLLDIIPTLSPEQASAIFNVAKGLTFHKLEELAKTWRDVYIVCVSKIPDEEIKKEVIPEANIDSGLSQPVNQRIWSARILGAAACRLDSKRVEQQIFPKASQLSQDTDYEVRKAMCKELAAIIKHVGMRIAKRTIFGDFFDLLNDEEGTVQESALESLMLLSDVMDAEGRISTLIPVWKKICSDTHPKIALKAAELFGHFFWKSRNEINDSDKLIFMSYYQLSCSSTDINCRRICVFNLPAIVNVVKPQNFGLYKLDKILRAFASDGDEQIQLTLAKSFHDIAIILAGNSYKFLGDTLTSLLNSDNEQILCAIYGHLGDILVSFNIGGDSSTSPNPKHAAYMENVYTSITETKKFFEEAPNIGWRLHELVLRSYEVFPAIFDSDILFDQCVQPITKMLSESYPGPIKRAAIKVLVTYLRRLKKSEHHEAILRQLLEIKDDKSYHIRMLFFDICEEVMIQFSQKFFRSYFFYGYLGLSRDLVPNVRIRFVSILPLVRHCLRVPTDNMLLSKLIDSTEALAVRDSDAGVMLTMSQFHVKFGLLHTPDCCQKSKPQQADDFGLENEQNEQNEQKQDLKKSYSATSLTDKYLMEQLSWEALAAGEDDRLKEEAEHKQLYFQLDPAKKKEANARSSRKEFKRSSSSATTTTVPPVSRKGSVSIKNRRSSISTSPVEKTTSKPPSFLGKKDEHLPPLPTLKQMSIFPASSTDTSEEFLKIGIPVITSELRKPITVNLKVPASASLAQSSTSAPSSSFKRQSKSAGLGTQKLPIAK